MFRFGLCLLDYPVNKFGTKIVKLLELGYRNYWASSASFLINNHVPSDFQAGTLVFGIVAGDAGEGSLGVGFYTDARRIGVVPEPETYAMLLAGLGLISFVARRRSLSLT